MRARAWAALRPPTSCAPWPRPESASSPRSGEVARRAGGVIVMASDPSVRSADTSPRFAQGGKSDFFAYKNGEMHAEGVALATIAAQVGTPFYCYSAGALRAAWKEFADGIKGMNAEVCYAMKANSSLAV